MSEIKEHISLAPYTTFRIGGPARFFARAKSVDDIRTALSFARERSLPFFVLGGGSNILIDDAGFNGIVIKIEIPGVEQEKDTVAAGADPHTKLHVAKGGISGEQLKGIQTTGLDTFLPAKSLQNHDVQLSVGAGESWDALAAYAVRRGLFGIENLSGIPGSAGAAPVQNIGAYGAELQDSLLRVEVLDAESGELKNFSRDECGFGYRTSLFKKNPGRFIITRITLGLSHSGVPDISYRDLAERFAGHPAPSLAEVREAVLAIRARKFPDLSKEGTAGSFFLNPVVSKDTADGLAKRFPGLPVFGAAGGVKISLAYVLDRGLNLKGLSHGGARLYEKQPLVVVARRGASAAEVRALAEEVRARVREAAGIELAPEVRII